MANKNINMYSYIMVDHQSDLNAQIHKPIQQSQRIKYNCFDVSTNHIIFGASSGGIYIYKKNPCIFLKILPTKEGAIRLISISDDENFVAVSNETGLIIIIENCFNGQDVKFQIYNQHNNKITILKWNLHELYSGDTNGKVCVTILKNIQSKTIFQFPFATLMQLDTTIVQIDCHLQYLLVSTLTKTLLYNTSQEQCKQIGSKLRYGRYGACFQNLPKCVADCQIQIGQEIHEPQAIAAPNESIAIFCSRPGLRIWQVDFNTTVLYTHQFKKANAIGKSVYKVTDEKKCRGMKENIHFNIENDYNVTFYKMHRLKRNLLLTFYENIVYIFIATGKNVKLLYNVMLSACIRDIRIEDNYFYVLLVNDTLRCYSIFDLQCFISYALKWEQYLLCADICVDFKENLYEMFDKPEQFHILSTLKLNLELLEEFQLLNDLKDLFDFIYSKQELSTLTSIKSVNDCNDMIQNRNGDEATNVSKNAMLSDESLVNQFDNVDFCVTIIIKQYKLNVRYRTDYREYTKLLKTKSISEIMSLFERIAAKDSKFDENLNIWCNKQFLNLLTDIKATAFDEVLKEYTLKCFKNINKTNKICGKCKYPLPTAKDVIPKYYLLICDIFKEEASILRDVATEIPYVWKCLLECDLGSVSINKLLPIIIQFSDIAVLEYYSNKINYDLWNEAVNLMIKIKSKHCLHCDNLMEFDTSSTISWQCFANVAMRAVSPISVLKLFKNHAAFIRNADLGPEFYQNFIFIAAMDTAGKNRGTTTQIFQSSMTDDSQKIEMEGFLAKYLNNAFLQRNNHWHLDLSTISGLENILSKSNK